MKVIVTHRVAGTITDDVIEAPRVTVQLWDSGRCRVNAYEDGAEEPSHTMYYRRADKIRRDS